MEEPKLTIGLEIHAELKTKTKMFCDCLNDSDEHHPNINICPICVGHPGTLPTINKKAVEGVLKVGLALGGKLFPKKRAKFDRKNYFYPDLPKGYQISQYDEPLVEGGQLIGVRIRRVHLEEDAGTLTHEKNHSLADYNRAGLPLMELVTEPDVTSASQAVAFAKELQLIIRHLGITDADMEKGQMRLEANVSLNMGAKVEVKNINSFKALEAAIQYEHKRQKGLLEKGRAIAQETRGWNEAKQATVSQRSKEEAHDYRYFSEPDLPPFDASAFNIKQLEAEIPELPSAKKKRFIEEFGLSPEQAGVLIQDRLSAKFFEEAVSELSEEVKNGDESAIKLLFNYFTSDLWGLMQKEEITFQYLKIDPKDFAHLIVLLIKKEISSRIAKDMLVEMVKTGLDPHDIIKEGKWQQVSDPNHLKGLAEKIIKDNPKTVSDYKSGKTTALQFLIGRAMSELGGKANPAILREILENLLKP